MTRIALIADLHFGRADPDLATTLLAALAQARPDLVLVAGDFVQRARASQFRLARTFLQGLPAPWRAVPGNHDLPLFNLPARLAAPHAAFRRWIAPETEFTLQLEDTVVIGLDTTTPWRHQRGHVRPAQVERVSQALRGAERRLPVILAHHPFHQRESVAKELMIGAPEALESWAEGPPHMLLTGHLHEFLVEPFVARKGGGRTLQVHCGTSASRRTRGTPNDFALIETEPGGVQIERRVFEGGRGFRGAERYRYRATAEGWARREEAA
jgi:predicted MPP superfamily phosphohydrolase